LGEFNFKEMDWNTRKTGGLLLCFILCFSKLLIAQTTLTQEEWVEKQFNAMSPNERIAQLMMIRAHSNLGPDHIAKVENLIKDYQVGGLCFFQGTPEKEVELTNRYQALTKHVPLMIAMDAEWGVGMRFKEKTINFPRALMLGAIQDNRLLYDMGREVARQGNRLGIHINFAPVVDVNNNSENPVINTRSFGEDRYNVAVKGYMYMKGMQDHGMIACAKHFPGHGDTNVDSHYDLPVINHDRRRLDSIEMFPFRVLAQHGIGSMMVAHLKVPSIDNTPNQPTSLSPNTVTNILRNEIGFDGLIFTDGLGMQGVAKHYKPGEVEVKSLQAGNDILLLPQDVPAALKAINRSIAAGELDLADINRRVKKVLRSKYQLELTAFQPLEVASATDDINQGQAYALKRKLIRNALTMVRNKDDLVPIKHLDKTKIASLSIGATKRTKFQQTLDNYAKFTHHNIGKEISGSKSKQLIVELKSFDIVIVGLHDMSQFASKDFGISSSTKKFLEALNKETKVILTVFGNPYALKYFDYVDYLLEAYNEDEDTEDLAAQAIFGAFGMSGRLPVTASSKSRFNDGVNTLQNFRLGYGVPEEVGMNSKILAKIDDIAKEAVNSRATPGCVVLVAKDGQVVFHKAYGHHTYKKLQRTKTSDIFDLASITKIAASTISVMKLHDEGNLSVFEATDNYLPPLRGTNKMGILLQDMMAHRARLTAWIPFYKQTITHSRRNPRPMTKFYSSRAKTNFTIPVTDRLFMKEDFVSEIKNQIYTSDLRSKPGYKYSDLAFYMIGDMVHFKAGMPLDEFAEKTFYNKLGLSTAGFKPWLHYSLSKVVPTEEDRYFRRQRVHGYVHDMGAAMLGGVSGHAGLFANANDLAIIMQMILNGGRYGGEAFFSESTVKTFTKRHPECTRRGLGFDMKELDPERSQNVCEEASDNTFGHLGFTGTCTWVDPDQGLVYVFLSNRTYPSMNNYKLSKNDYRPRIQQVIYEALEAATPKE
jgi:beta-glucosidase-like glycosyl hydrolase/CubicO group peptidase (beta-lactamase class C family)